ncbi:hypothetical protein NP493_1626g00006 [Ridgeia piscesae]|uniref:Uncharacterized protein n=1 Tax=Ridgeia piscesae TaxID=27915 RepID=A0AAD9JYH6_RIDPI|nr:hypothetical protein NP493_1626g00006 [Ridgeia piscesae]
MSVSHTLPVYPATHLQLCPLPSLTHVAPFTHGLLPHPLTSCFVVDIVKSTSVVVLSSTSFPFFVLGVG